MISLFLEFVYALNLYPVNLQCGLYKINGELQQNPSGLSIIQLQKNTTSPIEFVIIGGGSEYKIKYIRAKVVTEVYVPKPINESLGKNLVYLQKINLAKINDVDNYQLIKKEKCNLNDKFIP